MVEKFNYFSYSDLFWVRFNPHLISFGFRGLPEDVHFTIGFDGRSPDINLHLTKNTIDSQNKPHIKIFIIEKEILKEDALQILNSCFNYFFKPLNIDENNINGIDIKFLSFNDMLNEETGNTVLAEFMNFLVSNSKVKQKKRLKINGDIEEKFNALKGEESFQEPLLKKIVDFQLTSERITDGGLIIFEDEVVTAIKINEKWYSIPGVFSPYDFLVHLLGHKLARDLKWKVNRALVSIKKSNSYADTKDLNKPIRIVRKK